MKELQYVRSRKKDLNRQGNETPFLCYPNSHYNNGMINDHGSRYTNDEDWCMVKLDEMGGLVGEMGGQVQRWVAKLVDMGDKVAR